MFFIFTGTSSSFTKSSLFDDNKDDMSSVPKNCNNYPGIYVYSAGRMEMANPPPRAILIFRANLEVTLLFPFEFHYKHLTGADDCGAGDRDRLAGDDIAAVIQAVGDFCIVRPRDVLLAPGVVDIDEDGIGIIVPEISVGIVP